ncbi:DUF4132 domain-containing protein [Glycomyces buryatensis]|uniref:DUF4132 domain-containing protein n=1 Tax=Glycomyces buryatensis TaxID=2570927 RepID=A0A4S8Q761_9ACTN|nr:DUF4132 domain-containing protein [Glycomyces buryatensis]THV38505.1 DUF4132 domain-containing protein [Glycomyces buryatensis]
MQLPDENRLRLPTEWLDEAFPRRGSASVRPVELDGNAKAQSAARLDRCRTPVIESIDHPGSEATIAAAAHEYLGGEANPVGAGAVNAAITAITTSVAVAQGTPREADVLQIDAWIAEHGLSFAACAAIEGIGVSALEFGSRLPYTRHIRRQSSNDMVIDWAKVGHINWSWIRSDGIPELVRIRRILDASTDEEYRDAIAAMSHHRDTVVKRIAAAFIAPTEREWVDEACRDVLATRYAYGSPDWLVYASVTSGGQLAAAGLKSFGEYTLSPASLASLIDGIGAESLEFLTATLNQFRSAADRMLLNPGISLLPSDQAMRFLLQNLVEHRTMEAAVEAAERFPVRSLRTIAALAPTADAGHLVRLAGVARTNPFLEPALAQLEAAERDIIDGLLGDPPQAAPNEQLPQLLVAPPWTVKRSKRKAEVIDGIEAPAEARPVWSDGEQATWAALAEPWDRTGAENVWWERMADEIRRGDRKDVPPKLIAFSSDETAREMLGRWDGEYRYPDAYVMQRILARFEEESLPKIMALVSRNVNTQEVLAPILSLEAARLAADWLVRLKSARLTAHAWLERHGVEAARLLIPDALGKAKKLRANAEAALRQLSDLHGPECVLNAAEDYGPGIADALRPLLDADPLEPLAKVPHIGDWANPGMLPPVYLRDSEQCLPEGAVRHLITVVAIATPDLPYRGVEVIAEHCDPGSLAQFSLALFELWLASESPSKDGWALTQLAHFGDEQAVRRLTPFIRIWPGEGQHKRAVTGLGVLGAIGSEAALAAIHGISQKVKFKALKAEAASQIEAIAAGLGLSGEQLADRLVPDFGLGDEEALVLDFGPRQFKVAFDEQLKPLLHDMDGKPRKSLPKPGAKDYPELAEESRKRFAQLKKDLRTVAADQVKRLEKAMIEGRSWTTAEFGECFATHPLVSHLARRLVWLAESGGGRVAFRVAEDGSLADAEDEELELAEDAVIRLAHPLRMEEQESQAWGAILGDYEILQPFDQLNRPVMALTDEELKTGHLTRFEDITVDYGRILGMTKKGWVRGEPQDAGIEPGIHYELPTAGYVCIHLDPGLVVGYTDWAERQTLRTVRFCDTAYGWYGGASDLVLSEIDPVVASEVLIALTGLTAEA